MIRSRSRKSGRIVVGAAAIWIAISVSAQTPLDPQVAQLMERALHDAENFRLQLRSSEYEAKMFVQEWDGGGRLRGTAKATAIMRPGDAHPMTFVSREVHGKVRLPSENDRDKDDNDKSTLLDFAREHRMSERYDYVVEGKENVGGETAIRIRFSPTKRQPEKNRADRFLDTITGTAWVGEASNRLVKLDMRLVQPLQLFWILAVLKECTIQYELVEPGEILGHAKLNIVFAVTTPIYSIRQQHDVELDHFHRRDAMTTAAR
ncbi:MAG: hypothetical protein QOI07_1657 [Verrucomicrobiota bacterium]|jgi:hypothetical protein